MMTRLKQSCLLLAIMGMLIFFVLRYFEKISSEENIYKVGNNKLTKNAPKTLKAINYQSPTSDSSPSVNIRFYKKSKTKECLILLWAHLHANITVPKHPLCNGGCEVTYERSRIDEATAVIFMMKRMKFNDLPDPSKRRPNQVYVWFCRETPWTSKNYHKKSLTEWKEYFNWTMTYRFDSDVDGSMIPVTARPFLNYMYKKRQENGLSVLEEGEKFSELREHIFTTSAEYCEKNRNTPSPVPDVSKKIGLTVWITRDCTTTKGAKQRLKMIKEMISDGLQVGGHSVCLNETGKRDEIKMDNFLDFVSSYKFYLAFENTYHCRDYITEKNWFNSFYLGTVPVVWGGKKEEYIRIAPPNSFIFYEDFSSSKEIVEYLQYLDKNDTAYMEYFSWRKLYPCNYPLYKLDDAEEYPFASSNKFSPFLNAYCSLCKMLKDGLHLSKKQTIHSLNEYWYKNESPECLT